MVAWPMPFWKKTSPGLSSSKIKKAIIFGALGQCLELLPFLSKFFAFTCATV